MAFCTRCGSALPTDARFCPACGNAVDAPAPAAPPVDAGPTGAAPRPAPSAKPRPAEKRSSGAGGLILPVIIAVALFVILVMLWSQRDGTRPITAPDRNEAPATAAKESATAPEPSASAAADATRTTIASLDSAFRDDPLWRPYNAATVDALSLSSPLPLNSCHQPGLPFASFNVPASLISALSDADDVVKWPQLARLQLNANVRGSGKKSVNMTHHLSRRLQFLLSAGGKSEKASVRPGGSGSGPESR